MYLQLMLQRITFLGKCWKMKPAEWVPHFFDMSHFVVCMLNTKFIIKNQLDSGLIIFKVSDYTTYNLLTWGGRFQEENDDIEFWNCVISNILKPEDYRMFLILLFEWIQFYSNFQVSKN